jgi:hypothetical protein
MKTRCKPGDLALVIHDTSLCESNIGRFVQVRGPLQMNADLQLRCWLIKPVSRCTWRVEETPGQVENQTVFWRSEIEHPDAWLLPIRPEDVDAERDAGVRTTMDTGQEVRQPVYVTTGNGDMSDLKTAASMQDQIDEAIRRMDRERDRR